MGRDILDYERMVERAMRSVVVDTLKQIAEVGLPGAHHLYITFMTNRRDVDIPDFLREKFPEEMTIVLQHQFWDFRVRKDHFVVTLSFNDVPATLSIPFAAIKAFADPSVNFGLQLKFDGEVEVGSPNSLIGKENIEDIPKDFPDNPVGKVDCVKEGDANVVTLDTFRKK